VITTLGPLLTARASAHVRQATGDIYWATRVGAILDFPSRAQTLVSPNAMEALNVDNGGERSAPPIVRKLFGTPAPYLPGIRSSVYWNK
jgi:hypothetical protein